MAYSNFATTSATTFPNVTGAPTGLTSAVSGTTATQLNLSWNAVTGATTYRLERSTNGTDWTPAYTGPNTSFNNTGLTAGTTYQYRVFAINTGGESPPSTTLITITLCTAPTSVTAVAQDQSTDIIVSWATRTGAASYIVEWATASGGTYTALPAVTGTSLRHEVGATNTQRFYRVKAVNSSGNSANSSVVNTRTAPAAPTNFVATVISQTQVDLTAAVPSGATKNKFEYQADGANTWTTAQDALGASCTVTGLSANTKYNFRVSSDNL
jgi:fibronectin type 3 domain-containing protein